jgi:SAM-dependent methyltransferase
MNPRLLPWLQCCDCRSRLELRADGHLACVACRQQFEVSDGAPRFTRDASPTAQAFGYGWGRHARSVEPMRSASPYHLQLMRDVLHAPACTGLILDAGCGDGMDLAMLALESSCEVVGVELSDGGVATSLARTSGNDRAHVIQADLLKLPLASGTFDGAYSYGVVHHTPDPPRAVREIARTLKPGASLLLYVYEDFSDRSWMWRALLAIVTLLRQITTRLPGTALMAVCRVSSPIVYGLCTLPARRFPWASRFPYRHSEHAWDLSADLYDRFSAPIEQRYSETTAASLARDAGLHVVGTAQCRGWMVWARKP